MPKVKKNPPSWTDLYTVAELVKPFESVFDTATEIPLKLTETLAKAGDLEARKILRLIAKEKAKPDHQQVDNLVLDGYLKLAKIEAGPFKEKLFDTLAGFAKKRATGLVSAGLPELVEVGLKNAGTADDKDNKLMTKFLEANGILNAPPGAQTNINVNASAQAGAQVRSLTTFEETLTEFERAEERAVKQLPPARTIPIPATVKQKEAV